MFRNITVIFLKEPALLGKHMLGVTALNRAPLGQDNATKKIKLECSEETICEAEEEVSACSCDY